MTVLLRSAQSLEYVLIPVATQDEDGAAVNPTGDTVALAFVAEGTALAVDTAFVPAAWDTNDADPTAPIYSAILLIGPGAVYAPVANTRVDVYVRITDNPETPAIRGGMIRFL